MVDVYALALAALVLGAGSLADLYGRRKLYLVGLVLFAVASLACGLAPNAGLLIAARAVQGIGGAAMLATTIALINTSYEGRDRGTAFGVWGAVVGAAGRARPDPGRRAHRALLALDLLRQPADRVLAVVLTLIAVQEARQPNAPRPDVAGHRAVHPRRRRGRLRPGAGRGRRLGRGAVAWGPLAGGLVVLGGLGAGRAAPPGPMLDVRLFRIALVHRDHAGRAAAQRRRLRRADLHLAVAAVDRRAVAAAGRLVFIPLSVVQLRVAGAGGRFLQTLPPRFVLGGGLLLIGVGVLLLALVDADSTWRVLVRRARRARRRGRDGQPDAGLGRAGRRARASAAGWPPAR